MKILSIREQVFFCIICCLSMGTLSAIAQQNTNSSASAPYAGATVVDFEKKVQLQLPGQGSSGSNIWVQPHTHLILKQPSPTNWQRLELLLGRIKTEIQKRISGSPPFQIGTPSAVISVRGTRFFVEVDKHKVTEVDVEEGEVQLENIKGIGAPILIKAGSSSRVGEKSAPEPAQPTQELQRQLQKSSSGNNGGNGQGKGQGQGPANQSHPQPHSPPVPRGNGHR